MGGSLVGLNAPNTCISGVAPSSSGRELRNRSTPKKKRKEYSRYRSGGKEKRRKEKRKEEKLTRDLIRNRQRIRKGAPGTIHSYISRKER